MTLNTLSFPVDIPWKRLCVSPDMIDQKVCDRDFPPRWRSSVVVFAYEPPAEQQTYDDYVVSYLKVVCTITGYQPDDNEVGVAGGSYLYRWHDGAPEDAVLEEIGEYYACYGAILEVAIKPGGNAPVADYPFFAGFEPKKRELFELVTQTGETLSRSLDAVQVQKGTTTTQGTEVLDADKKVDWSALGAIAGGAAGAVAGGPAGAAAGSVLGGAAGSLLGAGGEKSIKDINQTEQTNLETTDRSREMREQHSHTTQLTQMYHEFTSYHLGTNRGVFFMLPRPHVVQSFHTFVNGPRQLEGIQEVFLVVMRPKTVAHICVEAYLETAHIHFEKGVYEKNAIAFLVRANDKVKGASPDTKMYEFPIEVPLGWEVDTDNQGGVVVQSYAYTGPGKYPPVVIGGWSKPVGVFLLAGEGQTVKAVCGLSPALTGDKHNSHYIADLRIELKLRRPGSKAQDIPRELFLTGRGVCCCPSPPQHVGKFDESFVAEQTIQLGSQYAGGSASGITMRQANQLRSAIGRMMIGSTTGNQRYARGTATYAMSRILGQRVAQLIERPGHPDNQLVEEIVGLDRQVRSAVVAVASGLRRSDLLRMELNETIDRFGLTHEQALHLRRATLRLEEPRVKPKDRWDPPRVRNPIEMPDVLGYGLDEAGATLHAAKFEIDEIVYQDSEQPSAVVLSQEPRAGELVRGTTRVKLVLATGLSVRIPAVVDRPLSEVLCALRDAGLESEPNLEFVPAEGRDPQRVVDSTPSAGTYVTPHAGIVLKVAARSHEPRKGKPHRPP